MRTVMTVVGFSFLMAVAAAAQHESMPMGKKDQGKMGKSMTVTGCVAEGSETGHYVLTNGMMTGHTTAQSYDLMGGDLKAHVGHKVAVTGTMADGKAMGKGKMMSKDKMEKGEGEGEHKMGAADVHSALQVKSVKMIAATCS